MPNQACILRAQLLQAVDMPGGNAQVSVFEAVVGEARPERRHDSDGGSAGFGVCEIEHYVRPMAG